MEILPNKNIYERAKKLNLRVNLDEKAKKILSDIRGGASFADKAREFGTDGTSSKGGDLGWFTSGQMVKPFQKAVFDAKKTAFWAMW